MADFRPLSRRNDPTYDEPQEGLPDYLVEPVTAWVQRATYNGALGQTDPEVLRRIQLRLRMTPPFRWAPYGEISAQLDLEGRIARNHELALDVLDYLLHTCRAHEQAELESLLRQGGSAWGVERLRGGHARLARRSPGPVAEAMDRIESDSDRAHHHLRVAWGALVGRNPDPSTAYREAIRAVEASARPLVTPSDQTATLGKMIRALRDKPDKWQVVLQKSGVEEIADMADMLWKGQLDRHGTDDESVPLAVSRQEADAAVYTAITLVRYFTGGLIRPVSQK